MKGETINIYYPVKIQEYIQKIDYKEKDEKKRLDIVNDILSQSEVIEFLETQNDGKQYTFLEMLSNYLCFGVDKKNFGFAKRQEYKEEPKQYDNDPYASDYIRYLDYLREKRKNTLNNKFVIDRIIKTVNDDVRLCKEYLHPKVNIKCTSSPLLEPDFTECDYKNAEHIKNIIMLPMTNVTTYYLKEDLLKLVVKNKTCFTLRELEIINLFNLGEQKMTDVADFFNVPVSSISRSVKTISEKISKL